MAGNYPDAPSWRMAWDVDGTQVYRIDEAGNALQLTGADLSNLNDENPSTQWTGEGFIVYWIAVIFPELRDVDAYLWQGAMTGAGGAFSGPLQVSSDTTNCIDGTWVTIKSQEWTSGAFSTSSTEKDPLRTAIESNTQLGIKAMRFQTKSGNGQRYIGAIHLFGEPAPGENLQRLEIWHPTLDQRLGPADLDWGDVPRNSSEIREFRVKNMHPTLTANSVRAAMSILTDTTPSVAGQQSISKDGGATWAAHQTLTSPLGPEAISPVLQIRRQTPANATLSLWWYRLFANCSSWT